MGIQLHGADHRRVVACEPETADTLVLGDRLDDWAAWLLSDPDDRGTRSFAPRLARPQRATGP